MALSYVWKRYDTAQSNLNYGLGSGANPEYVQCFVEPHPLTRVVRVVAGVAAAYNMRYRQSSEWSHQPATWYLYLDIQNASAPAGYPKRVHERTGAMHMGAHQVMPIGATSPFPLPDVRTFWWTPDIDVDVRRSDFGRGLDPEGSPSYTLEFRVNGIPHSAPGEQTMQHYASYRAFLKICCEIGQPD